MIIPSIGGNMGFFTSKEEREKERVRDLMEEGLANLNGMQNGASYLKGQYYQKAITCFNEALKIDSRNHTAFYHRGLALYQMGEFEEAIKSFSEALEIQPISQAWIYRGDALIKLNNKTEGLISFKNAFELNPDELDNISPICKFLLLDGKYTEMTNILNLFLSNHPDSVRAWDYKMNFLLALGDDREAFECYKKILKLDPINAWKFVDSSEINQNRVKEVNKILILDESDIIGKYLCNYCEESLSLFYAYPYKWGHMNYEGINTVFGLPTSFGFLANQDLCPALGGAPGTHLENHACIVVLTKDNLFIVPPEKTYKKEKIITIPLEYIISFVQLKDIYGFENVFLIKYGKKELYIRINKNPNPFYDSITNSIKMRRETSNRPIQQNVHIDFSSIKDYLKNGGVVMQTFKCPGCGASLEFPDKEDSTICRYCGNKIKAVDLFEKIKSLL